MLSQKILEILHVANGCFGVLGIIFRQILFKFLALILSASQNYYPKRARTAH